MCCWTHSGPPPCVRHGGEVGVVNVVLHSVHHGRKHEDPHGDEEQQTAHLHTQTHVLFPHFVLTALPTNWIQLSLDLVHTWTSPGGIQKVNFWIAMIVFFDTSFRLCWPAGSTVSVWSRTLWGLSSDEPASKSWRFAWDAWSSEPDPPTERNSTEEEEEEEGCQLMFMVCCIEGPHQFLSSGLMFLSVWMSFVY